MASRPPDETDDNRARARWLMIGLHRILGVALVITGILSVRGITGWPETLGYGLIVIGLADVFVVPQVLARAWRTPRQ
jgi:hypothetical protein